MWGRREKETEQTAKRKRKKERGEWLGGWHSESRSVGRDGGLGIFFLGKWGPDTFSFWYIIKVRVCVCVFCVVGFV